MSKKMMFIALIVGLLSPNFIWAYENSQVTTCEEVVYGDEVLDANGFPMYDHWDRQCLNLKTVFEKGDNIAILAKAEAMADNYKWKVLLYKDGILAEEIESEWNYVDGGIHEYATIPVNFDNLFVGFYNVEVWLKQKDDSQAYQVFGTTYIAHKGAPYYNPSTTVCESWEHPTTDITAPNYWDLQAVNPGNYFSPGNTVCILPKAEDISQNHQWRLAMYRDGEHWFTITPVLNDVGTGWSYTSSQPCFPVYYEGNYKAIVILDVDEGDDYISENSFIVGNNPPVAGDFNGDSIVDLADVILSLKLLVGETVEIKTGSDMTGDGKIDIRDTLAVLKEVAN